jgi:hypothetical protein
VDIFNEYKFSFFVYMIILIYLFFNHLLIFTMAITNISYW